MAGFTLFGKVSLDNSGFARGIGGLKAGLAPAVEGLGKQIKQRLVAAITLGTSVAVLRKQLENAVEIRSGANKTGQSAETFQALRVVAKEAGITVDALTEAIDKGGPAAEAFEEALIDAQEELERTGRIIDEKTVERLASLSDKLDELFGRLAPGLAMFIDGIIKLYSAIKDSPVTQKMADVAVGVWDQVTGNGFGGKQGTLWSENPMLNGKGEDVREDPTKLTYEPIKAAVRAALDAVAESKVKEVKVEKEKADKALPTSSLTQVGGIMSQGMKSVSLQQKMVDHLRDIGALISKVGKD